MRGKDQKILWSLTYEDFTYNFSALQWRKSNKDSVETLLQILIPAFTAPNQG